MKPIRIICATREAEQDFSTKTALGRSLLALEAANPVEVRLHAENKQGLSTLYNRAIEEARQSPAILVFVHDDVHLCDFLWSQRLREGLAAFDVIGLAGNTRRQEGQPAWAFVDDRFTWDERIYLSGLVGHGKGFPCAVTHFGPVPQACKLLDGLFIAADSERLISAGVSFDEQFTFHFYDMDFCRAAELGGLSMGTWDLSVVHESGGAFGTPSWREGLQRYRLKYGEEPAHAEVELTAAASKQTPVHHSHNSDLLKLIPLDARRIVEVGCSSGALAREYKKLNPDVHYIGIEIEPSYAQLARAHCDEVFDMNIEALTPELIQGELAADCWIFGDVLEHLYDPWQVLLNLRQSLAPGASIVACIPNAQHWSVQAKLCMGDFCYEDSGLFDRTHIRWFTLKTMIEMFNRAGLRVEEGVPRVFEEPNRALVLPAIRAMALATGVDPEGAMQDAMPLQYVLRAVVA